jgi:hypothetical protein
MFKTLKNKLFNFLDRMAITSLDATSSIQRWDRDAYKYIEGDHSLFVVVAMLSGKPNYVLYRNSINKWLPPHENEILSNIDKARIFQKVRDYLDSRRVSYTVE